MLIFINKKYLWNLQLKTVIFDLILLKIDIKQQKLWFETKQ